MVKKISHVQPMCAGSPAPDLEREKMKKKPAVLPRGYRTCTASLAVTDVPAALAFYETAFGAELRASDDDTDPHFCFDQDRQFNDVCHRRVGRNRASTGRRSPRGRHRTPHVCRRCRCNLRGRGCSWRQAIGLSRSTPIGVSAVPPLPTRSATSGPWRPDRRTCPRKRSKSGAMRGLALQSPGATGDDAPSDDQPAPVAA